MVQINYSGKFMPNYPLNFKLKLLFISFYPLLFSAEVFSQEKEEDIPDKEISHTLFITGNTALAKDNISLPILNQIAESSQSPGAASLLLMGNFTDAKEGINNSHLDKLLEPLKKFKGNIIFVPGFNEWENRNQDKIDDLEKALQDANEKIQVLPNDGCPIESEEINDDFVLITVDSQWYLEDWDDFPEMNTGCDIKTREQFFIEFKDELKDNFGKTKIVALHHPVISNTRLGFINTIGGFTPQSFKSEIQRVFRGRLETLAKQFDDVIFVSGNDRNLQYLEDGNLPQIISGAAAATQYAKARGESFASEEKGYAKLVIFKDGSSAVYFYAVNGQTQQLLFSKFIQRERPDLEDVKFEKLTNRRPTTFASIYTPEETEKSGLYRMLWGENNRNIYSREIEAPNLFLDNYPGNLRPIKEGGGQQSRSLRFINDTKNEFTLRALRKSAISFLQANAVKGHYVEEYLQNTIAQRYVQDFFTTAHPYAPFAVGDLAEALDIYHVEPKIYYVPKQKGLGIHNDEYGDELYMLEEHVGSENKAFEIFGSPDDILSTTDFLEEIKESEKSYVDESSYIKARLLDMLIGDWDRHEDQWRWAEFEKENGDKIYQPVPRDRDMAFPNYKGPIISFLKAGFPMLRKMQSYDGEIEDLKWFNLSGYPLDQALIKESTWEDWEEQVQFIQKNLTDDVINKAFEGLPKEVQDESINRIKTTLKQRRDNLLNTAKEYQEYLLKNEVLTGTQEDDNFLITRKENGITTIEIERNGKIYYSRDYNSDITKEIWVYGLDGRDNFKIQGEGSDLIDLKILGGEENDVYDFNNTRKAKIYDFKSKENTILNDNSRKWLVDSYDINNYDPEKRKLAENKIIPSVGFDTDAGFTLGFKDIYTTYGLVRNPFTSQHELSVNYYFATNGFEIAYFGEFAHIFYNWNLGISARYAGPNYFLNYFGTGNGTIYEKDLVERDFNRVRMEQLQFSPSLIWRNERGSSFIISAVAESLEVLRDEDKFIGQIFSQDNPVFDRQYYAGTEATYTYRNKTNPPYPIRGMDFNFTAGYKSNIDEYDNKFGYLNPSLSINYPLHHSGAAVFATKLGGKVIIGDNYEFYHAATLGGNENLRGFRNDRFNGSSAFYHSTDLRLAFARFKTSFVPVMMGITAGFDYGRVWTEGEDFDEWHSNYGGSFWINGFNVITANVGYYHGDDGNRINFILGFKF